MSEKKTGYQPLILLNGAYKPKRDNDIRLGMVFSTFERRAVSISMQFKRAASNQSTDEEIDALKALLKECEKYEHERDEAFDAHLASIFSSSKEKEWENAKAKQAQALGRYVDYKKKIRSKDIPYDLCVFDSSIGAVGFNIPVDQALSLALLARQGQMVELNYTPLREGEQTPKTPQILLRNPKKVIGQNISGLNTLKL